ncbi:putative DNA mismatch repair protein Msh6-like protein, partial [Leptotrombidium deliense]
TDRSLVILDELGRGTSTYDGTAIAYSVINEISHRIKCRTLFSTHYHSLVDDFSHSEFVEFMHMACKVEKEDLADPTNEAITFLYKLKPGFCPKSYGFNAAKLAGIPENIIRVGFEVAQNMEREHLVKKLMSENLDAAETRRLIKLIRDIKF